MSIKDYCDKWNEITEENGYYISAFSNTVYSRDANTYANSGCTYNASTGILSWDITIFLSNDKVTTFSAFGLTLHFKMLLESENLRYAILYFLLI